MAQNVDISSGQVPLKGVVLCCTSLTQEDRSKVADVATQMGAVHKLDLTSDVTHLIVGNITTPKYRYVAKDRPDIKVLRPEWIEAVRESWMEGGDVEVDALERKYHLPPFAGLQICVTGFDDLEQRNYISTTIEEQGAAYHGDLTKVVTHLVAAAPQGAKYTHARQWGINIVSLKWFEDSLHRGMSLDESFYDPVMPLDQQGKDAFRTQPKPRTSLGKREREESQDVSEDVGKKRLRRTASTRLESQSQDMWQDISARKDVSVDPSEADQWDEKSTHATTHVSETTSRSAAEGSSSMRRSISALPVELGEEPHGLFSGIYVLIHGFDLKRSTLLEHFLEPNGAHVVRTPTELEDASVNAFFKDRYLLIPHTDPDEALKLPEVPANTITATEWWVERCIHYKRLLNPVEDVLSRPLWKAEVTAFSRQIVSTTGFAGVDLRQVAETVALMGATYQEKILPSTSVIVSGSGSIKKEKAYYAHKHKIPVVSADWLWYCLETRKYQLLEKFLLTLPAFDPKQLIGEPSTSSPAPSDMLSRKSGRASTGKEDSVPKRLSNTRKRHVTPSLLLHTTKASPAASRSQPQPIVHEDEDDSASIDSVPVAAQVTTTSQRGSQPLQELSPNLSPRKTTENSNEEASDATLTKEDVVQARSRTVSPSRPPSPPISPSSPQQAPNNVDPQPPTRPREELTADLAQLLNKSAASRPSSAAGSQPPQKRKNRPLGRAPSGISNRSASTSTLSENIAAQVESHGQDSAADGFTYSREEPLPPSTQLGYETPEAEAHRLQMSKKMGMKLQDDGGMKRVAGLGTVKDSMSSAEAGVGNRVRGRQRK